jgi:hypothetical protein
MSTDQEVTEVLSYYDVLMGQGDDSSAVWRRTYYVPDPPKIPGAPGSVPNTGPNTGPVVAPAPIPAVEEPGWTGPRFYTLLRGDDWNDPQVGVPAVVPYTFATRAMSNYAEGEGGLALPGFAGTSGQPLTEAQRASIRQALDAWSQVSGLTFVEVSDSTLLGFHGIRFLMESVDSQGLLGETMPSGGPYGFNVVFNRVAYGGSALQPGTDGYWTALHEIGHAIGLKHPFSGSPTLKASEDSNVNTIMSYTDKGNLSGLGAFDAAAVQHLYGAPEAKASAPVRWFQGPGGSLLIVADNQDNYVLGSVARDVVYGGGGGDYIKLDAGDDYVVAGAGSDAVFGNDGADVLYIGKLRSQAAITSAYVEDGEETQGTVLMANDELDTYYGVETLDFIDGSFAADPRGDAAKLWRLYDTLFDRVPDDVGFAHWMDALRDGTTSLGKIATALVSSAEFTNRHAGKSNEGVVRALYENALGREPNKDEGGDVSYWASVMRIAGRGNAALDFSEAEEHREKLEETSNKFANGKFYYNQDSVDVLRAYMTVLDRVPDADGLVHWTNTREAGFSQHDLIAQLASSHEFQVRYGALSNRGFVEELYENVLGRDGDAAGVAAWTRVLDAGVDSRAGVALGFSNSAEMTKLISIYLINADALYL